MNAIDNLGYLLAQAAKLEAKIKAEKAKLIAQGVGAYEGTLFRATVSQSVRERLDSEAIDLALSKADFSSQYITAHTVKTECNTVRVVAKTTQTKIAA